MVTNSNRKSKPRKSEDKPRKPYKDFPLSPHASGKWQKKIRGRIYYFGAWARRENGKLARVPGDGWKEALELYKAQADDLHAGRTPRPTTSGDSLTVADLLNRFLTAKQRKLDAGELSQRTFDEYVSMGQRVADSFGKSRQAEDLRPEDFEKLRAKAAKDWGPARLGKFVQIVRTIFKYGFESGLIEKPVLFGPEFKRPAADVMRKHRAASAKRLFTADEIRSLLDGAKTQQLKAMILLGVNCGFGNHDVADLPFSAIDLDRGWISFPRPKTGIDRRCPLWPETIAAIKGAINERPIPNEADVDCVFITRWGHRWLQGKTNSVGLEFGKLLRRQGINGRTGLGFYSLRHTHRTIADATKDFPAVRLIMGHADNSIDAVYREHIDDSRLRAVTEHVRAWLFGKTVE